MKFFSKKVLMISLIILTKSLPLFAEDKFESNIVTHSFEKVTSEISIKNLQNTYILEKSNLKEQFDMGIIKREDYQKKIGLIDYVIKILKEKFLPPSNRIKNLQNEFGITPKNFLEFTAIPNPDKYQKNGTEIPGLRHLLREYPSKPNVVPQGSKILNCIIAISTHQDSVHSIIGSGMYLKNGYFITAHHVVKNQQDLYVVTGKHHKNDIQPAHVFKIDTGSIIFDTTKDIAVFRTYPKANGLFSQRVFMEPDCILNKKLDLFTKMKIVGFPRGSYTAIETINCFLVDFFDSWDSNATKLRADILGIGATWHGYSGAPVMDQENNCVIGILRAQMSEDNINGVPIEFVPVKENAFRAVNIKHAYNLLPKQKTTP